MIDPTTIVGLFHARVAELGNREALLERDGDLWKSFSWNEWHRRSRAIAAALLERDVQPGENVAICSYSRREWVEADIGVLMVGARTVPVYHNLNAATVGYIIRDCKARVVFAEGPIQVGSLLDANGSGLPNTVEHVVHFSDRQTPAAKPGEPEPAEIRLADIAPKNGRARLTSLDDFIAEGERALPGRAGDLDRRMDAVAPGAVAKIVYTSGTTGDPKGALLTHGSFIAVVESVQEGIKLRPTDVTLLFLPLAHVYAQLTYHAALKVGFTIAFARSMLTAVDDAASVKPHFFTTVPRLFEKIHATALAQVDSAGGLKKRVFEWATDVGYRVSAVRQRGEALGLADQVRRQIADRLVYSKLKARLGGRIRYMISGGAPLPRHIIEFFHAADLLIIEGYGMTENASLSHYNRVDHLKFGTVGQVIPGLEVRIAEDGEILMRGPNVMLGYLDKPEATAEAIDADGWLHSGDVGFVDEEGFLTITDRKKEIIVTSGGKNVPPAPIEHALCQSKLVSQALVFGDRRKYLVALLVPDFEYAKIWARDHGISLPDGPAIIDSTELRAAVKAEVDAVNARLDPFSTVKGFALLPREFSIQDGEMTPSLKLKRKVVAERYREIIADLYPGEPVSC